MWPFKQYLFPTVKRLLLVTVSAHFQTEMSCCIQIDCIDGSTIAAYDNTASVLSKSMTLHGNDTRFVTIYLHLSCIRVWYGSFSFTWDFENFWRIYLLVGTVHVYSYVKEFMTSS